MSNDTLARLVKYADLLKSKLSSPVPAKQKNRAQNYKNFLEKDLKMTNVKIDNLKLLAPVGKK